MLWFLAVLFLLTGLFLFTTTFVHALRACRSSRWPTTEATISHSQVDESHDESATSRPNVRFTYAVGGDAHVSDGLHMGWPVSGSKKWATKITARYPLGARVLVAFDPKNPSVSVLEPGSHKWLFVGAVFSSLFLGFGIRAVLMAVDRMAG